MGTLMGSMTTQLQDPECFALSDRDLLRRFLQDDDQQAFAAVVKRHQLLVLSVCRRILVLEQDVDDAFQATFVALARRPRSIRKATSLSSWLYTVAWRTSWRLIRQRRNRNVEPLSEHPAQEPPGPLDRIASAQDCHILDEELNLLPDRYREVLVMAYFTDRTSQQIADELNVSKGTIDGRMRQAKNLLRVRLARRGVGIAALTMVAGLTSSASAASAPLMQSTLALGAQTLAGSAPAAAQLSHLESLIRPETAMLSSKLITSGVLCASALLGAAGLSLFPADENGSGAAGTTATVNSVVDETQTDSSSDVVIHASPAVTAPQGSAGSAASGGAVEGAVAGAGGYGAEAGFGGEGYGLGGYGASFDSEAGLGGGAVVSDQNFEANFAGGGMEGGGYAEQMGGGGGGYGMDMMGGYGEGMGAGFGPMSGAQPYPDPQTHWLQQMLQQPVGKVELTEPTKLQDVLLQLADSFGKLPKGGVLKLKIDEDLPIRGVRNDSLQTTDALALSGMTLQNALSQVVSSASRGTHVNLKWQIRDGAIVVDAVDGRHFMPYPDDARPNEKWMHEILDAPVSQLNFPGNTPLSEVLDSLARDLTSTYGNDRFQLRIVLDQGELDLEAMSIDEVTVTDLNLNDITVRNALRLIFEQTESDSKSPTPLTWAIHNEVLLITTRAKANSEALLSTRVYPVGHLLFAMQVNQAETAGMGSSDYGMATAVQYGGGGMEGGGLGMGMGGGDFGGGFEPPMPQHPLIQLVMSMTSGSRDDAWHEMGGPGRLDLFGKNLVVRQTPAGHDEVVRLLNLLSKANNPGTNLQSHIRRNGSVTTY